MSVSLFDTHFHLEGDDIQKVIQEAQSNQVDFLNLISCTLAEAKKYTRLQKDYSCLSVSVGVHPCYVQEHSFEDLSQFDDLLECEKISAIGEVGLDYYHSTEHKQKQKEFFSYFLSLALKYKQTAIIHSRESFEDCYDMIASHLRASHPFIMHCYTGDSTWAKKFLDLGAYISYSGIVTFKNAHEIRDSLKYVPKDRLLIETDAPYLAPVPFRGKRNKPAFLHAIFEYLCEYFNEDKLELAARLLENSKRALQLC